MKQERSRGVAGSWCAGTAVLAVLASLSSVGVPGVAEAQSPGVVFVQSDDAPAEETEEERKERMRRIAEERRAAAEAERDKEKVQAIAAYEAMAKAYLSGRQMEEMGKEMRRHTRHLTREQREALKHMTDMAPMYRPGWWAGTKKQDKNSFEAEIWGRKFWANYVPTRELGLQAVFPTEEFNPRTGEIEVVDLIVLVTWKPLMVDSPDPAQGRLAREHGYTLATSRS